MSLVTVHPFGVASPGGGPRILRALLEGPPMPVTVVCTSPAAPPAATGGVIESWLPGRPHLGRVEATRLGGVAAALEWPGQPGLRRRLAALARRREATAVHAVAHSMSFAAAERVAHRLRLPFFLSVHDDLHYALAGHPDRPLAMKALRGVWQRAQQRFVISDAMGEEYQRRFGDLSYSVITDGVDDGHIEPEPVVSNGRRLYFAGLFHRSYAPGFRSLLEALGRLPTGRAGNVVCRCGALPSDVGSSVVPISILPFGSEEDVRTDLRQADLLYLPLPFEAEHRPLVRFSLSTKLIAYLASGRPILYHGPAEGAAYELLARERAAILVISPDVESVARGLEADPDERRAVAQRALDLARRRFRLVDQRRRFWDEIRGAGA